MTSYLCEIAGVSRSGFYKYFSIASISVRKFKEEKDKVLKENVLKEINFKNRKKGARQIKMVLEDQFGINII